MSRKIGRAKNSKGEGKRQRANAMDDTKRGEKSEDEAAEQDAEAKARVSPDAKARRDSGATAAEPPPSPAAEPAVLRTLTGADVDQVA